MDVFLDDQLLSFMVSIPNFTMSENEFLDTVAAKCIVDPRILPKFLGNQDALKHWSKYTRLVRQLQAWTQPLAKPSLQKVLTERAGWTTDLNEEVEVPAWAMEQMRVELELRATRVFTPVTQ